MRLSSFLHWQKLCLYLEVLFFKEINDNIFLRQIFDTFGVLSSKRKTSVVPASFETEAEVVLKKRREPSSSLATDGERISNKKLSFEGSSESQAPSKLDDPKSRYLSDHRPIQEESSTKVWSLYIKEALRGWLVPKYCRLAKLILSLRLSCERVSQSNLIKTNLKKQTLSGIS